MPNIVANKAINVEKKQNIVVDTKLNTIVDKIIDNG